MTLWNIFFSWQAARKAVKEKTVEKEELKETQPPVQMEPTPALADSKLPVGRTMSSIHVDYNYFEIGTGQVRLPNLVSGSRWLKEGILSEPDCGSHMWTCSSSGVGGISWSCIWTGEFLCSGFSHRDVSDSTRGRENRRVLPASHLQRVLQYLPSSEWCLSLSNASLHLIILKLKWRIMNTTNLNV